MGRKIARIDPDIAERLNISTGDALELSSLGKKSTVLNWPAKANDKGKGLIRIDGFTRNSLSAVWESVKKYKEAFNKYTSPEVQSKLLKYPDSAGMSPHLFKKVAVPGICVE